nr:hypothetical protein [Tanacetum cinerariifolium]
MVKKEVNELCAERLARNANPLALIATAQANQDPYYQTSKSHKSYAPLLKPLIPTKSHTTTRYKSKEIAKPITPPSETASEEDIDPEQASMDTDMQKILALIVKYFKKIYKPTNNNLKTSSNSRNNNVDTTSWENVGSPVVKQFGIQCFNCKEFRHFAKECRKPKKVKDSAYYKEKMLLCKQAEQGVSLQAEQYDWLADTDEEIDDTDSEPLTQVQNDAGYNMFANDLQHSEQSESISNTCLVETDDSNVIPDSPDMCNDDIQNDQNDVESDDEHVVLANSKLDTEFEKYKAFNDCTIDYDKLERKLNENLRQLAQKDIEIKEGVNHKTNVSRPQHKSNQLKDKVVPNNSQVKLKKTQVEVHPRIPSISNKMKSVTATKKPNVVPISTRKSKGQANKSVATPHKKTIASKSNNQKPQSYFRMLYEKTSTVCFGNDQFAPIFRYGDLVQGNVAFRKSTCFVRDLQGNDLLTGNRGSDLYTTSLQESISSTPLCLMAKASPTQAWLWHRRLSHLNFDYINLLSKKAIVIGLPKLKYVKDQLCSSCELSKEKRSSFKSKVVSSLKRRLNLLDMDLCGPMRVASINEKKYILSNGYLVYNKRTRMIVESIHIRFDEIKEVSKTSVANDTSGLVRSNPQGKQPTMNIQPTSAPSTPTYVHAEENNNDQAEEEHSPDDEFTNLFYHPLEQVRGNPSRPVQTKQQLATDLEMCMFALTKRCRRNFINLTDFRFVDPDHLEKVYRLWKALYGLKQALRAWCDELSKFLTSKGFTKGQSIGTPMATKPKLDADLSGTLVDQTDYRSKIGSLMYLTSSRPDIVQAGSSFGLTAFLDIDHVGCIDSRKSTYGGIQFLGDKLVSWMSKKQNCTTMSSAEAEYVALSASCAQVMRTQF